MHIANRVIDRSTLVGREADDTLSLEWQTRRKRRFVLTTDNGVEFLLDLPTPTTLRDGDALQVGASLVVVRAKPEPLLEMRARDADSLARLAWHIGNRHAACEVADGLLYVQADHTLADMARGLGAEVRSVMRAFSPEGGAYAGHGHGHSSGSHTHANGPGELSH